MGAQGRQPVSPPGSLEPPGPPGAFSPAILAAGPQHTPVRRPTGSTGSQGGAAKGQVVRGPGGLGWAEWGEGIFARCSQTQGRLPPGLGLTAVVRGDPGRLPVGSPQTQSSSVPCTPISPPGGGMGRTPEQRTDAVSGLGPMATTGYPRQEHGWGPRHRPSEPPGAPCPQRWWPWGAHGRGVWSPNPPGIWGSAWLPLQEAHAGTSQQEWLGFPKSRGGEVQWGAEAGSRQLQPQVPGRVCPPALKAARQHGTAVS